MKFDRCSDTLVNNENEEENTESNQNYRSAAHTENEHKKQEKLMTGISLKRAAILIIVVFLILIGLVLLLAVIVRCDESKFIAYHENRKTSLETAYAQFFTKWEDQVKEREDNYKSKKIEWRPGTQFSDELFEPAGHERGRLLLYVARASHKNGTVVGKYLPEYGTMYYGYDGKVWVARKFEILSYPHGSVSWLPRRKGEGLPSEDSLVFGGAAPDKQESTYICRLKMDGHLIIGKILESSLGCIASMYDGEHTRDTFEILVINDMGSLIGIDS